MGVTFIHGDNQERRTALDELVNSVTNSIVNLPFPKSTLRSLATALLEISPGECRRGEHPDTWRKDAQERRATYPELPTDPDRDERDVDLLGELHFGFPHLTDEAQR